MAQILSEPNCTPTPQPLTLPNLYFYCLCCSSICIDPAKKSVAKAMYLNPSADGAVPGNIILDTNAVRTLCRYEVPVLMVHEGEPGHHMQVVCFVLINV